MKEADVKLKENKATYEELEEQKGVKERTNIQHSCLMISKNKIYEKSKI